MIDRLLLRLAVLALIALLGLPAKGWAAGDEETESVPGGPVSDLAEAMEISRRLHSPIVHDRIARVADIDGVALKVHDIQPEDERFDLVVPEQQPASGFGVLVFVSPIPTWRITSDWRREVEKRGLIYVSARNSGNTENVLQRRIPLALHGLELVRRKWRVDPERIYVSGFSGGSRIAQRLAQAYPDVFRGVMLVGGSDPLGEDGLVPPPAELMQLFQSRTRVVFATGQEDLPNRPKDERTREAFTAYCVSGVEVVPVRRIGHSLPAGRAARNAFQSLETPVVGTSDLESCRQQLQAEVHSRLDRVASLIASGQVPEAAGVLKETDDRYGGMAGPRSIGLARQVDRILGEDGDARQP